MFYRFLALGLSGQGHAKQRKLIYVQMLALKMCL